MTKRLLILIFSLAVAAAALFSATPLSAQSYTTSTAPNVQLSDASQFVSNPDNILSAATVSEINRMCLELRDNGLAEVAVLVLDSVDENSLDLFAHNVLNRWRVGQKGANNGLVISVVRQQRDIQFETGYGLEGVLPDAICKRIQTVYMIPLLREGNWNEGVLAGLRAVYNILNDNQEELTALTATSTDDEGNLLVSLTMLLPLVLVVLLFLSIARCNKKRGGNQGNNSGGPDSFGGGSGSFLGGFLLGGGLGGSRGGGFGGGFGGGRSGGGGARSGF